MKRINSSRPAVAGVVLLITLAAGVAGSSPAPAAKEHQVLALSRRFATGSGPGCEVRGTKELQIDAGDSVAWTNCSAEAHTVTFDDGESDVTIVPGQRTTRAFPSPGTFSYFCRIHLNNGMEGVVFVRRPAASSGASSPPPPPATTATTRARSSSPSPSPSPTTAAPAPAGIPTTAPAPEVEIAAALTPGGPLTSSTTTTETTADRARLASEEDLATERAGSPGLRALAWLALAASSVATLVSAHRWSTRTRGRTPA